MKRISFLLAVALCVIKADAQSFSTDSSGAAMFVYEVKLIDEFIERFNDERNSFIRQEYRKKKKEAVISRNQLMLRLFNTERTDWDAEQLKAFLKQVLHPKKPQYLDFLDSNWYAEASCVFKSKNDVVAIPLVLQIKNIDPKGARWVIAGIGNNAIIDSMAATPIANKRNSDYHFIASSSHSNNFISLKNALQDKDNLTDYFTQQLLATPKCKKLLQALQQDQLQLSHVKAIKFHFYQIDNWVFTVERFNRQTMNKGWLISNLKKLTKSEKEDNKNKLLFRDGDES